VDDFQEAKGYWKLKAVAPYHTREELALEEAVDVSLRQTRMKVQGGSNMTGTNCDLFTHNQSRSYLNHLVYITNTFVIRLEYIFTSILPIQGHCFQPFLLTSENHPNKNNWKKTAYANP
jgi:hypothetical protein